MKISVIMPVYNSEKLLGKAIDSVLQQNFEDFELILVDDGATDGSGKICDEYAKQYDNVVVIHKENGGICDARNAGLDRAQGEYISFIDNDDLFLPGLLDDNYKLAVKHKADVVRFERRRIVITEDGKEYAEERKGLEHIHGLIDGLCTLNKDDMIKQYSNIRNSGALNGIWNGLYRRSLIEENNIRFDTGIRFGHEDLMFNLQVFQASERYVFNNKEYYSYFYRYESSTSAKFDTNKIDSIWKIAGFENHMLVQYGKTKEEQLQNIMGHIYVIVEHLNRRACSLNHSEKRAYLKSYVKYMSDKGIGLKHSFKLIKKRKLKEFGLSLLLFMRCYRLLMLLIKGYYKMVG